MSSSRVTVLDVAKVAGVSRATVSLVLRESPSISQPTRERVQAAMKQLGYIYDRRAASLRASKSHIVGLVIHDLTNPVFSELAVGVDLVSQAEGYVQFLAHTDDNVERQRRVITTMRENGIGGLIVSPAHGTKPVEFEPLTSVGIPVVQVGRSLATAKLPSVVSDNAAGTKAAVTHLLELGHRRIAFLGGLTDSRTFSVRQGGYRRALSNAGIKPDARIVINTEPSRSGGRRALMQLLEIGARRRPTAAVCFNDAVAFGVYDGLREANLTPGRDLSITGFDDVAEARFAYPPLTTVAINPQGVGEAAARLLLDLIGGVKPATTRITLPVELVTRESCTPPANA